jgi:chromosome segregation ATPase
MDPKASDGQTDAREGLDDEATNELAVLDLAATAGQIAATTDDSVVDPNVLALRKVDAEIRQLMESWVDLENQLTGRDAEIRRLRDRGRSVEDDLQATRQELASARADCEKLRGEAANQRTRAEEQKRLQHEHREHAEKLQRELFVARGQVDELAGELGHARANGEKLGIQLAEHRDALIGMAAQLRKFEKATNGHDEDKAALAVRIADVERLNAELTSHWQDAEDSSRQATEQLLAISGRAEELKHELRQAQEAASQLEQKLNEKAAAIGSLQVGAQAHEKARTELQAEVRKAKEALDLVRREAEAVGAAQIRDLQRELKVERENGSALRKQLKTSERIINQAAAALESQQQKAEAAAIAATGERERLLATIAERDLAMVGLHDRVSALDMERAQLVAQLDELRAQLVAADSEFQMKRNSIAALGTEFNRLGLIQANVRKLDGMISRQLSGGEPANAAAERPRNGRLIVSLDGDRAVKYPLFKRDMVIGRSRDTDICIAGPHTSRRHARVFIDGGVVVIEDLGSLNGIIVNEARVRRQELHDGDLLVVGGARLRFIDLDEKVTRGRNETNTAH